MAEETKTKAEELEAEEMDMDELDQVSGGAMNKVHVGKTGDITADMQKRT